MATAETHVQRDAIGISVPEQAASKQPVTRVTPVNQTPVDSDPTTPRSDASNPFETDIEAMLTTSSAEKSRGSVILNRKNDCQVWPGKKDWKQRAKASKKRRTCAFMHRLDRRTRIMVKVLIIVLIIGIAVAVGFGVSKPLGAPIWGDHHNNS